MSPTSPIYASAASIVALALDEENACVTSMATVFVDTAEAEL